MTTTRDKINIYKIHRNLLAKNVNHFAQNFGNYMKNHNKKIGERLVLEIPRRILKRYVFSVVNI